MHEQNEGQDALAKTLEEFSDKGPSCQGEEASPSSEDDVVVATLGDAVAKKLSLKHFIEDPGATSVDIYDDITADKKDIILLSLGQALVAIIYGTGSLIFRSDDNPHRADNFSPVLPQHLVKCESEIYFRSSASPGSGSRP